MEKTLDMTKYLDEYARNSRMMLAWVYPAEFRTILEKTVELQVDAAKTFNKTFVDNVSKFTVSK